jgi:zinc protease
MMARTRRLTYHRDMTSPTRSLAAALVVALVLTAVPVLAAPLAHREVLPNGIVLLVAERPAIPIVAVRVFTRAGAVLDPPDRGGLANLTGALLTRGTAKRSGPELDSAIEFVGGSLEAGAGRDGLYVSLEVLKKDLGLGLDLLTEVLLTPTFPEAELKRQAAEIRAAIKRSEEDPPAVAGRALARLLYPNHPYGRPVEGTEESVGRLTRDDVVKFHQEHVRPDSTIVTVVGAVTVDEVRREIQARLGAWPRPASPPPSVPVAGGAPHPDSREIKRQLTQSTILLGRPAINQKDPDYFSFAVTSYILGGGSTGRLYTRVREQGGLAYSVGSYLSPGKYASSFGVSSQTRTAEVPKVLDAVREELTRMMKEPVGDHELELAKAYLAGSFPLRLNTSRRVADFLVAIEEQGLGLDYADRYVAEVRKVTAADVQRVAQRFFDPSAFSRVIVGAIP